MKTYSIICFAPGNKVNADILMSGISETSEGFRFRPEFELKVIQSQRKTYYNENCTEVKDWCFNVTEGATGGGKVYFCYAIVEENPIDEAKRGRFNAAKSMCSTCHGSGHVDHNGSRYGCTHGVSYEDRTLSTGKIL